MTSSVAGTSCMLCREPAIDRISMVVDGRRRSVRVCERHRPSDDVGEPTALGEGLGADELMFRFMSGRLSLDLTATVGERWRNKVERLRTPADLQRWIADAGLSDNAVSVTRRELTDIQHLREVIYTAALSAVADEPIPDGVEATLTEFAAAASSAPTLHRGQLTWNAPGARAVASTVARDAIDLLSSPLRQRIRECASPECALLFVDTSRPGQRRWCSTDTCGNRSRAAAYRQRQRP